jgi:hypothetical protein
MRVVVEHVHDRNEVTRGRIDHVASGRQEPGLEQEPRRARRVPLEPTRACLVHECGQFPIVWERDAGVLSPDTEDLVTAIEQLDHVAEQPSLGLRQALMAAAITEGGRVVGPVCEVNRHVQGCGDLKDERRTGRGPLQARVNAGGKCARERDPEVRAFMVDDELLMNEPPVHLDRLRNAIQQTTNLGVS